VSRFTNGARVAQAPRLVAGTSLIARHDPTGLAADLSLRSLGSRYGLEDDPSVRLHGYTVMDIGASYQRGPFELRAVLANVFDTDWESAEFYYESQFGFDDAPVEDFHFTPGIPRSLYVTFSYSF
ncbi:MAG: hypothetical protein ACRETX_17405, partial [Steroidobacteraceae bacterium]